MLGLNPGVRVLAEVGDYPAAWASLERALVAADEGSFLAELSGCLDAPRLELRKAQEDLAMAWLRDVRVPEGSTFTDIDPARSHLHAVAIDPDNP